MNWLSRIVTKSPWIEDKIWKWIEKDRHMWDDDDDWKQEPYYVIQGDGSSLSIKINHDEIIVHEHDDSMCFECRQAQATHGINQRGFCQKCAFQLDVIERETERAKRMEWYPIGFFVSRSRTTFPFVCRDGIDYEKVYVRALEQDRDMKLIGLGGKLESLSAREMIILERPQDCYVLLDSEIMEKITGDNRR
ncbi:hypothetical protein [Thermoactinomyces sp. DSM 45892]|uniref:hypothetical protein n=1 Tax=Thermoactinomyces sp. DSM 45892 TaxID=1882753 RepID=UPI00089C9DFB|nr:hypothetical protein [Thermoactinomyces sp. DSM 45892]SDY83220.1 hypothetical protein SAMN05444416_10920 [Thermoactinomyces sp. DSM 45892]